MLARYGEDAAMLLLRLRSELLAIHMGSRKGVPAIDPAPGVMGMNWWEGVCTQSFWGVLVLSAFVYVSFVLELGSSLSPATSNVVKSLSLSMMHFCLLVSSICSLSPKSFLITPMCCLYGPFLTLISFPTMLMRFMLGLITVSSAPTDFLSLFVFSMATRPRSSECNSWTYSHALAFYMCFIVPFNPFHCPSTILT